MHPHRWDASGLAMRYLLHPEVRAVLRALYGEEPIAAQTMYYYKPPGARGQALHQDNFYLQVQPGTCIAAWTAIDRAVPENGGLYVVPGTQDMDIACPEVANAGESFTTHLVKAPKGKKAIPAELNPGDTLFFNGSLIHGSPPNRSATEWRRSFICHYMPQSAVHISKAYRPLFNFDGQEVEYAAATGGGPCGAEFQPGEYGSHGQWH
jgi:ectoine hydroxylase-related dioxygenase (phytanoyl-CoA dioxygenase family)